MIYLLFVLLLNGDEFQIGKFDSFESCDAEAIKVIKENRDIFSIRCVLDEQANK